MITAILGLESVHKMLLIVICVDWAETISPGQFVLMDAVVAGDKTPGFTFKLKVVLILGTVILMFQVVLKSMVIVSTIQSITSSPTVVNFQAPYVHKPNPTTRKNWLTRFTTTVL